MVVCLRVELIRCALCTEQCFWMQIRFFVFVFGVRFVMRKRKEGDERNRTLSQCSL